METVNNSEMELSGIGVSSMFEESEGRVEVDVDMNLSTTESEIVDGIAISLLFEEESDSDDVFVQEVNALVEPAAASVLNVITQHSEKILTKKFNKSDYLDTRFEVTCGKTCVRVSISSDWKVLKAWLNQVIKDAKPAFPEIAKLSPNVVYVDVINVDEQLKVIFFLAKTRSIFFLVEESSGVPPLKLMRFCCDPKVTLIETAGAHVKSTLLKFFEAKYTDKWYSEGAANWGQKERQDGAVIAVGMNGLAMQVNPTISDLKDMFLKLLDVLIFPDHPHNIQLNEDQLDLQRISTAIVTGLLSIQLYQKLMRKFEE